jgi:hypothetical protein
MSIPNPSKLDVNQVLPAAFEDASGALRTKSVSGALITEAFDYISAAYPTSTTEVYTYKSGGAGGTTVGTVTVTYVDATKAQVSSVARS